METKKGILIAGGIVGLISVFLVMLGNPANMGFCIACFIRDISGSIGLHRAAVVQYIRPEVLGLVLGAMLIAFSKGEFNPKGGSSPVTRFILGVVVMIGALVFLGCPLRMALRIAGGDLNAIVGLVGFISGIGIGILFLNKGFSLKRAYAQSAIEGSAFPAVTLLLLVLFVAAPTLFILSESGPGALHAPILISLLFGAGVGALAQRTRLCMVGGIRDMIMFKDAHLLTGFIALIVMAGIGSIATGNFTLGFEGQPIAHSDGLWNFLGMVAVGWGSVLLGGCPLRQLILSGEGNTDSAVTIIGLLVGAAIAHNFGLAASPKGVPVQGMYALSFGLVVLAVISVFNTEGITKTA